MTRPVSIMTATFSVVIALLCASSAYAADSAEVSVDSVAVAVAASTKSENSAIAEIVFAGNQRATNLQKTTSAIIVADIASSRKSRVTR